MQAQRLIVLARAGFAARAVVYFLVGWISLQSARTGAPAGSNVRVLWSLRSAPMGFAVLIVMAAGLALYAAWRLAEARSPSMGPKDGARGIFRRIGFACSGLAHIGFAVIAVRAAIGLKAGASGSPQAWAVWLIAKPAGNLVLAAIGAGLLAAAVEQWRRAWTCDFLHELEGDVPAPAWVRGVGRAGYAARGVIFAVIAWFLFHAAWDSDGREAGGMQAAFDHLRAAPQGPLLLGVVAAGFCLFGLFCALQAMYERLPRYSAASTFASSPSRSAC